MGIFFLLILAGAVGCGVLVDAALAIPALFILRRTSRRGGGALLIVLAGIGILTGLFLFAVNRLPLPAVRPGSDYDIAALNLFLKWFLFTVTPGAALLISALITLFLPSIPARKSDTKEP